MAPLFDLLIIRHTLDSMPYWRILNLLCFFLSRDSYLADDVGDWREALHDGNRAEFRKGLLPFDYDIFRGL